MKPAVFTSLLFLSFSANAALVDNGSFTTDTATGLDWLDLSQTVDMYMTDALALHPEWRYATNTEVEGLFTESFAGYYDAGSSGFCTSWSYPGCYSGQYDDTFNFIALFSGAPPSGLNCLLGTYFDEDNAPRAIGGCIYNDGTLRSEVYGPEYGGTYINYVDGTTGYRPTTNNFTGALLVRSTAYVPVPAAVWLFGSAIAGLAFLRRTR